MAEVNLGKVSITPRGEYDPEAAYTRLDVVHDEATNASYLAKQDSTGVPLSNEAYWLKLVQGFGTSGQGSGATVLTHTKEGAVHQLTGELPAGESVYSVVFIATDAYVAGDTLTVNGEACGARSLNGKALSNMAWVAGAAVSCQYDKTGKVIWFPDLGDGEIVLDRQYYNFGLTIGEEEPAYPKDGHIWVKMEKARADRITRVYLDTAVRTSHEDGSLILKIPANDTTYFRITESKRINNNERTILSYDEVNASAKDSRPWKAGEYGDAVTIRKNRPVVYSKLDGVLDVENTYVYVEEERFFRQVTAKGKYIFSANGQVGQMTDYNTTRINVYGQTDENTWLRNTNIESHQYSNAVCMKASPDGKYLVYCSPDAPFLFGYRREGDVFYTLPTFNGPNATQIPYPPPADTGINQPVTHFMDFSRDGKYLAVANNTHGISLYKQAEDTYVFWKLLQPKDASNNAIPVNGVLFDETSTLETLYFWNTNSATYSPNLMWYTVTQAEDGDTFAFDFNSTKVAFGLTNTSEYVTCISFSPDGKRVLFGTGGTRLQSGNENATSNTATAPYIGYVYWKRRSGRSIGGAIFSQRVDYAGAMQGASSSYRYYTGNAVTCVKVLQDKSTPDAYTILWGTDCYRTFGYNGSTVYNPNKGLYARYYSGDIFSDIVTLYTSAWNAGNTPASITADANEQYVAVTWGYSNPSHKNTTFYEAGLNNSVPALTDVTSTRFAAASSIASYVAFYPGPVY